MDPLRAASVGIKPEDIQVTCEGGRYNGDWVVWVPDGGFQAIDGKFIITQSHNIFEVIRWRILHRAACHGA